MRILLAIAFLCPEYQLIAQQAAAVEFEVVSVKPNKSNYDGMSIDGNKGMWRATNITPKSLIINAYEILPDQIVGAPAWIDSAHFDIEGKYQEDPAMSRAESARQHRLRLQALLADRFQIQIHRETKESQAYILVVGKKGHKLTPSEPKSTMSARPGHMECKGMTTDSLARNLASRLRHPVANQTGLEGTFDFTLDYDADQTGSGATDPPKPSIFTAVQEQLGLKLESTKAPVEMLIIDRIERPVAN
jgi:uncharacterized protein (TIGR03435 family)